MSSTYADCPVCGLESKFDDELPGQTAECPQCKKSFTIETGESYDVAGSKKRTRIGPEIPEFEPEPEPSDPTEGKSWLEAWPKD